MRITRCNDPLNLIVVPNIKLKMLSFSEWIEVHALASKKKGKSIDLLLQSLKAKFQWVLNQAKKVGLPPPPELATFGMTCEDKKRKRTEFLKEMFVTEDIRVDGMNRNIIPPPKIILIDGFVISEPELSIKEPLSDGLGGDEDQLSVKHQLAVKGLSECKALESNIRRIKVIDIVNKVEDYLKIYSSAGMDISWPVVLINCPAKFACKLDKLLSLLVQRVEPLTVEGFLRSLALEKHLISIKVDEICLNSKNKEIAIVLLVLLVDYGIRSADVISVLLEICILSALDC
nr:hypothetical protein [Tanacetum cinerariifolium]